MTFSAYNDRADFRLAERRDSFSREAGAATGRGETARLAQHRKPDGDARDRSGARPFVRRNGPAVVRLSSRSRIAANSSAPCAASITLTIRRRPISTRSRKRSLAQTKPSRSHRGRKRQRLRFSTTARIGERKSAHRRSHRRDGESHLRGLARGDPMRNRRFAGGRSRARARHRAKAGEVVLFSPGTSSFDMFKSYADRGDQFRQLVHALPK